MPSSIISGSTNYGTPSSNSNSTYGVTKGGYQATPTGHQFRPRQGCCGKGKNK